MDLDIDWTPGIGDPSFMGWFTVLAYVAAAVLAALTARALRERLPVSELGRQARVWRAATILLVALAINKQLDLQSWFTATARALLREYGASADHRTLQFDFIVTLAAVACLFLAVAAWSVRTRLREYGPLLSGVTFMLTFIVMRAASFHHFDDLLASRYLGLRLNWVLELSGIATIVAAAALRLRHARRLDAPSPPDASG